MPDTDALAQRAYAAFYAALDRSFDPWGWAHLRPQVQAAWRVVVQVVRAGDVGEEQAEDERR